MYLNSNMFQLSILMKRFFPFLCALFVCNVALWAAPVDEEAARKIAADFSANVPSLRSGVQGKAELRTAYVSTRTDGGNRFYVFNKGRNGGFVIVSGDDRSEAVLGYADRGTFCWDSIPPAHGGLLCLPHLPRNANPLE